VEAIALRTNTVVVMSIFLYECILIKFGCPLTVIIDQGVQFINDVIKHLIDIETCELYNVLSLGEWVGRVY
jgi:hypothetical protein